jgi:hypothetical protein
MFVKGLKYVREEGLTCVVSQHVRRGFRIKLLFLFFLQLVDTTSYFARRSLRDSTIFFHISRSLSKDPMLVIENYVVLCIWHFYSTESSQFQLSSNSRSLSKSIMLVHANYVVV